MTDTTNESPKPGVAKGCLFWGVAFFFPPAAILWAAILPKGHPQKTLRLALPAVWLGVAVVFGIVDDSAPTDDAPKTATEQAAQPESPRIAETPPAKAVGNPTPPKLQEGSIRVLVFNETEHNPLPERAEVWIRGVGSWWLKESTRQGADGKTVEGWPVGKEEIIFVYPNGRDTPEVAVSIKLTEEMCLAGCDRDALRIFVYDDRVDVAGPLVRAATGEFTLVAKR